MCCTKSDLNKIIYNAALLSVISLTVMIYNVDKITNFDIQNESELVHGFNDSTAIHGVMIFLTNLTFCVNLLLCQGALDLASIELYFWPNPEIIKIWWILVYVPLLFVYSYGMASCFYLGITGEKSGNLFVNENDNRIAWGFIYLFGDIILTISIYFVPKWYSKL